MRTISIQELHANTGYWIRRTHEEHELIVTEGGKPIARIFPVAAASGENPFHRRTLLPGMAELMNRPIGGPDSAQIISEMRKRR